MKTIIITMITLFMMSIMAGCERGIGCNTYKVIDIDSIELTWTKTVVVTAVNECDLEKIELDIESFGKNQDKVEIGYRFKLDK